MYRVHMAEVHHFRLRTSQDFLVPSCVACCLGGGARNVNDIACHAPHLHILSQSRHEPCKAQGRWNGAPVLQASWLHTQALSQRTRISPLHSKFLRGPMVLSFYSVAICDAAARPYALTPDTTHPQTVIITTTFKTTDNLSAQGVASRASCSVAQIPLSPLHDFAAPFHRATEWWQPLKPLIYRTDIQSLCVCLHR